MIHICLVLCITWVPVRWILCFSGNPPFVFLSGIFLLCSLIWQINWWRWWSDIYYVRSTKHDARVISLQLYDVVARLVFFTWNWKLITGHSCASKQWNLITRVSQSWSDRQVAVAVAEWCCSVFTTPARLRVRETSTSAGQVRVPGQFVDWRDGMWCDWHGMVDWRWTRSDCGHLNARLCCVQTLGHLELHADNTQTSSMYRRTDVMYKRRIKLSWQFYVIKSVCSSRTNYTLHD